METLVKYLCEKEGKMAKSIDDIEYISGSLDIRGFFNGRPFETLDDIVSFWTEWIGNPQLPEFKKFIDSLKKLKPGEYLLFKDDTRIKNIVLRLDDKPVEDIAVK